MVKHEIEKTANLLPEPICQTKFHFVNIQFQKMNFIHLVNKSNVSKITLTGHDIPVATLFP